MSTHAPAPYAIPVFRGNPPERAIAVIDQQDRRCLSDIRFAAATLGNAAAFSGDGFDYRKCVNAFRRKPVACGEQVRVIIEQKTG